jgi:hypothetical protein
VSDATQTLPSATRPVRPDLTALLNSLKPGQKIRITQKVRLNCRPGRSWDTTVTGAFRGVNFLATGIATDRVPEDDIVVAVVHFAKDNGELSSVVLDVASRVAVV